MKVSLLQIPSGLGRTELENLVVSELNYESSLGVKSELYLLPEYVNASFHPEAIISNSLSRETLSDYFLFELSKKYKTNIVAGLSTYSMEVGNKAYYNSLIWFHANGENPIIYDKINLCDLPPYYEKNIFLGGNGSKFIRYGDQIFGLLICYDVYKEDLFSEYQEHGVSTILVSAAWPKIRIEKLIRILTERAKKFNLTILLSNYSGSEIDLEYGECTCRIDQLGQVEMIKKGDLFLNLDI